MLNFEKEVQQLTGRTTTMGVREILLERREKEGIELGMEKGKQLGHHEEALEIARNLRNIGIATEDIAKATGLSIQEIKGL